MRKKITTFAAMSLSALILLSGCGTASNPPSATTTTGTSAATTTDSNAPVAAKPVDWYVNLSWMGTAWGQDMISKEIKDKQGFDVHITVPAAGAEGQQLTTMIASGNLPDIVTMNWSDSNIPNMISKKMVVPLEPLAEQYSPDFKKYADPNVLTWNRQADGNVYGYNCYNSSESDIKTDTNLFSNDSFFVRKDIYEAIGSPDMSTQEGFLKALRDAKAKFPDSGNGPLIALATQTFYANNDPSGSVGMGRMLQDYLGIPAQKDGKLYDRFTDPEYISWLKTIRQAASENLMTADVFADNSDSFSNKLTVGRYFAVFAQWVDQQDPLNAWYKQDPNKAYISIKGPRNSDGKTQPTLLAGTPNGWLTSMISATGKHQANAIQWMTYMMSPQGMALQVAGIPSVMYNVDANGNLQREQSYLDDIAQNPDNLFNKYGVGWSYFTNTAQVDAMFTEQTDAIKAVTQPLKQYVSYNGAFEFVPFAANSPELTANTSINNLWDKNLPLMLRAKSDADFDKILSDFKAKRDSLGYQTLLAAQQKQLDENNKKITKFVDTSYMAEQIVQAAKDAAAK